MGGQNASGEGGGAPEGEEVPSAAGNVPDRRMFSIYWPKLEHTLGSTLSILRSLLFLNSSPEGFSAIT